MSHVLVCRRSRSREGFSRGRASACSPREKNMNVMKKLNKVIETVPEATAATVPAITSPHTVMLPVPQLSPSGWRCTAYTEEQRRFLEKELTRPAHLLPPIAVYPA